MCLCHFLNLDVYFFWLGLFCWTNTKITPHRWRTLTARTCLCKWRWATAKTSPISASQVDGKLSSHYSQFWMSEEKNNLSCFKARGDSNHGGGCVTLQLRGETPGSSTKVGKTEIFCLIKNISWKVTVTLTTEKGKEVSQFRYVSAYQ